MKTHCKRGHALTPENVRIRIQHRGYTQRNCRKCEVILQRQRDRANSGRREPYTPIETILESPSIRVLRLMRRFDWMYFVDVCDAMDVDDEDDAARMRLQGTLSFLAERGHLELVKSEKTGGHRKYRISPAGIQKLEHELKRYDLFLDAVSLDESDLEEAKRAA